MNTGPGNGSRLPAAPAPRPSPRYNLLSVAAPFAGVLAALGFLALFGAEGHWYWTWRGGVAMGLLAGACAVGLVLGVIALARSERLWGLTAVGLLLNTPVPLALLVAGLSQLATWLRYG
jgi:hypothetical protein